MNGSPWYSGIQLQTPSLQMALAPQGDGLQGSDLTGISANLVNLMNIGSQNKIKQWKILCDSRSMGLG